MHVIKNVFSHWQKGGWDIMNLGFFKNTCAIIIILKEKNGVFFKKFLKCFKMSLKTLWNTFFFKNPQFSPLK